MPCKPECDTIVLLLAKKGTLTNLNQTKEWLNHLGRSEPNRRQKVETKKRVVDNMIIKSLTEAGILINQIARGLCRPKNKQTNIKHSDYEEQ